jgi:Family of unknown function (DUF6600)
LNNESRKMSNIAMKRFSVVPAVIALAALASCQKQQTEAEKNAEVERQVQERLAAEHQAQQQQQLDQRQADLDAREKALAEKENAAATPTREERAQSESNESVSRPRATRERAVTTGYSTFYNKLEPYGDWIETGDYGYVFHPHQADSSRTWRPYTEGRWVYTDAGWTWISEEPFGWATYHYGRWTRLRGIGWVWVPESQWAPAWVSWRKSNDYVGWAPLPPEARFDQRTGIHNWSDNYYDIGPDQYCFVANREFGASRVEKTLLPPERNVVIINQTTNVTNITYNNTTIVNEGPSYDEMRAQSREPVQRFRLERNVNVDVSAEPPRPQVRGETVVVTAPVIAEPVAGERPPTVKQTLAAAVVDLGWAAISNQDEAKRTREKMKSEAPPPPNAPPKKFSRAVAPTSGNPPVAEGGTTSMTSSPSPAPSTTMSPVQTTTPVGTSIPKPAMTPRSTATSTPLSSASASPTVSQRRGRLLLPAGTPTPSASTAVPTTPTPFKRPTPIEEPTLIPAPSAPTGGGESQQPMTRGQFKSQAKKFNPRKVEPLPSGSPAPAATSISSPGTDSGSSPSPAGKLAKQEKKEQKREERQELKRERREGFENSSPAPSATP